MPSSVPAHIAAAAGSETPTEDKLERVRDSLRTYRDLLREEEDLKARLKATGEQIAAMKTKTLPDLFTEVGVDKLGLPAQGNLPAYDAKLVPYYFANISAEWPPEQQARGYDWLDSNGHGDLIRSTYTVFVGKDDRATALMVESALRALKVDFTIKLAVPWNTLTAWLKEQVEKKQTTPPLDLLGATVGSVVKLDQRKEPK